jgi:outer membrane protein insertion porin family
LNTTLVEKGSSQIELQGGYGGGGFIGTLGLTFNKFSARNLLKEAYKPLPMGDGQKVLIDYKRVHFSRLTAFRFQNRGLDKKPVQFSSSISYSKQFLNDFRTQRVDKTKSFNILTVSVG